MKKKPTVPAPEPISKAELKALFAAVEQLRAESPGIGKEQLCARFKEAMPDATDGFMRHVVVVNTWSAWRDQSRAAQRNLRRPEA